MRWRASSKACDQPPSFFCEKMIIAIFGSPLSLNAAAAGAAVIAMPMTAASIAEVPVLHVRAPFLALSCVPIRMTVAHRQFAVARRLQRGVDHARRDRRLAELARAERLQRILDPDAITAPTAMQPASPTPLTPSGLSGDGVSRCRISTFGTSVA